MRGKQKHTHPHTQSRGTVTHTHRKTLPARFTVAGGNAAGLREHVVDHVELGARAALLAARHCSYFLLDLNFYPRLRLNNLLMLQLLLLLLLLLQRLRLRLRKWRLGAVDGFRRWRLETHPFRDQVSLEEAQDRLNRLLWVSRGKSSHTNEKTRRVSVSSDD